MVCVCVVVCISMCFIVGWLVIVWVFCCWYVCSLSVLVF